MGETVVNQSRLAYELHRYVAARRGEEPPIFPSSAENDPISANPRNDQPEERTENSQKKLEGLENEAEGCQQCGLAENRTQVVFADGTAEADIFVIGEAPGAREDEQGLPFVGKAGELLRGGFEKVGLDKGQIYITNTVKCRPPDNRDPRAAELSSCRSYLDRQLDLVDPSVVLALGSFAIEYCLGEGTRVGASRGTVHEWNGRDLVTSYHPAYILRNNNEAQTFINDLNRARNLFE
jgi:DNA polymerase